LRNRFGGENKLLAKAHRREHICVGGQAGHADLSACLIQISPVDIRQRIETLEAKDEEMVESVAHVIWGEGRSMWVFGELVTYKVTAEQTGGAYALFEVTSGPGGGPPPHVQHREDEAFWVLEGEYEFMVEGCATRAGAGSLIYVPRGKLHAHKNPGDKPGRMLIIQTPGGLYEHFVGEIGEPATYESKPPVPNRPADTGRIMEVAAGYGIEILGHEH
jgi:quercetin dioxygenase-like cupin family protein